MGVIIPIVTQVIEGGIFVSINFEAEGFIPRFRTFGIEINEFNISDILYANIIKYREDHKRFPITLLIFK